MSYEFDSMLLRPEMVVCLNIHRKLSSVHFLSLTCEPEVPSFLTPGSAPLEVQVLQLPSRPHSGQTPLAECNTLSHKPVSNLRVFLNTVSQKLKSTPEGKPACQSCIKPRHEQGRTEVPVTDNQLLVQEGYCCKVSMCSL